ncbi:MAG: hypothetical protein JWN08_1176 [Frankiales bacterium]|nr:hypothetical protein [Frankiales bacterium]
MVAEAERLVADLAERYDMVLAPAEHPEAERAVRLVPARGAPLVLGVTSLPGLVLQAGTWAGPEMLPQCGCDAGAETADDVVGRVHDRVAAVVTGRMTEHLPAVGAG